MTTTEIFALIGICVSVIFSTISLVFVYLSWRKSRVIYDLERYKFAKDSGDSRDNDEKATDKKLAEVLSTGKYTIVSTYDMDDPTKGIRSKWNMVVLGRIKKK